MTSVVVHPVNDEDAAVWRLAQEVSGMFTDLPWALIGGLMVRILEIEHGVQAPWLTGDVDTVLDVRIVSTATEEAAARLQAAGFLPQRHDGEPDLPFHPRQGHRRRPGPRPSRRASQAHDRAAGRDDRGAR